MENINSNAQDLQRSIKKVDTIKQLIEEYENR